MPKERREQQQKRKSRNESTSPYARTAKPGTCVLNAPKKDNVIGPVNIPVVQGRTPYVKTKISNMEEFKRNVKELTHVKVKRKNYNHHYLVISLNNEGVDIIHYTSKMSASKGKIMMEHLRYAQESNLFDFTSGLYFITRPTYPSTKDEKEKAFRRASSRIDEKNYAVSFNNCEHLVTWILTGVATCEQLKSALGRVKADLFDSFLDSFNKRLIIQMFEIAIEAYNKESRIKEIIPVVSMLFNAYLALESIYNLCQLYRKGQLDLKLLFRVVTKKIGSFIATSVVGSFISAGISAFVPSIFSGFLASLLCQMFGAVVAGIAFDMMIQIALDLIECLL